jgi:AAA+ superfamily predicted ATPase
VQKLIHSYVRKPELNSQNVVFHVYGPYGSEKLPLAEAICNDLGLPLIVGDIGKILEGQLPFEKTLELIGREAVLQPAVLCLDNIDCLLADTDKSHFHLKSLLETIKNFSRLTFLLGCHHWKPQGLFGEHIFIDVGFSNP